MIGTVDTEYVYDFLMNRETGRHTDRVSCEILNDGAIVVRSYNTTIFRINNFKSEMYFDNTRYSNTTSKHQSAIVKYIEDRYIIASNVLEKKDSRWRKDSFRFLIDGVTLVDKVMLESMNSVKGVD
jgi:hypothetical protein